MSAFAVVSWPARKIVIASSRSCVFVIPSSGWVASEWVVFNLANAGVIGGTLAGSFGLVMAATALFAVGIALFLLGTRGAARSWWLLGYRILLGLIFLSSLTGLALSLRAR